MTSNNGSVTNQPSKPGFLHKSCKQNEQQVVEHLTAAALSFAAELKTNSTFLLSCSKRCKSPCKKEKVK